LYCENEFFLEFKCSFDVDECNEFMYPILTNAFNWTRNNKETPSKQTGPIRDHTSGRGIV